MIEEDRLLHWLQMISNTDFTVLNMSLFDFWIRVTATQRWERVHACLLSAN